MAIRTVRVLGDEILRKRSREVKELTPRIQELIDDMFETMYAEDGVGLAAVQVGVLRRVLVIDITENRKKPLALINPKVILREGMQITSEGCLSVPDESGTTIRPEHVIVEGLNRDFKKIRIDAHGLLAKALMHEIDHPDGIVFVDLVLDEEDPDGIKIREEEFEAWEKKVNIETMKDISSDDDISEVLTDESFK